MYVHVRADFSSLYLYADSMQDLVDELNIQFTSLFRPHIHKVEGVNECLWGVTP